MAGSFKYPQSSSDYKIDVALGSVANARQDAIYANRSGVLTGVSYDLWPDTGVSLVRLTSPERMSIVSTDINDDVGSTGATAVTISGVDSLWNEVTETVAMNGTTPVLTTNLFFRVNSLVVENSGTTGRNEGTITATSEITTEVQRVIEPAKGASSCSHFAVPRSRTAVVQSMGGSALVTENVQISLEISSSQATGDGYVRVVQGLTPFSIDLNYPVPEMSDIKLVATGITNNTNPVAHYTFMLLPT